MTCNGVSLGQKAARALGIVRQAAQLAIARRNLEGSIQATCKVDGNPVTSVDLDIEELMRGAIASEFPADAFIGEENGGDYGRATWVADPIDGTRNFACGGTYWCISLALTVERRSVIGIVSAPALGQEFIGIRGDGATLNGRPLRCTGTDTLRGALMGLGLHRSVAVDTTLDTVERALTAGASLRCPGAGALSLCHVASGELNAYAEARLRFWDIAAASLIIEEAGGWIDHSLSVQKASASGPVVAGVPGLESKLRETANTWLAAGKPAT